MANRPPIPIDVRRQLRAEVGFGCPICRSPFLVFHHFDPPYEQEAHFRPEGMLALCQGCHGAAPSWTKEKCRRLKKSKNIAKPVKGFFNAWEDDLNIFIRLGGNYSLGAAVPIVVGDEDVIRISKDPDTGWLQLSFVIRNKHGDPVLTMETNDFVMSPESVHDLHVTVSKHEIKLWVTPDDVGLNLQFRWLTWEQLAKRITGDRQQSAKRSERDLRDDILARLPLNLRKYVADNLPTASEANEETLALLKDQIERRCAKDGKIPFLDVRRMVIYHRGARTVVDKGIYVGKGVYGGNIMVDNGIKLPAYEQVAFRNGSLYAISNGVAVDDTAENAFESQLFSRQLVAVDGKRFVKCRFEGCRLIYKGGQLPWFNECNLLDCLWVFDEAAARSIEWLHLLCRGFGDRERQAVNQIFEDIRNRASEQSAESSGDGSGSRLSGLSD